MCWTKRVILIQNGKSVNKVSRKCSLIMKHNLLQRNWALNKHQRSFTFPNHWPKREFRRQYFQENRISETFTTRFRTWFKTLLFHWVMIWRCKSWLQYPCCKESTLQCCSMKKRFHYHIECFRMTKNTKKTLSFSEWNNLNRLFWISSKLRNCPHFTLWQMSLKKGRIKRKMLKKYQKEECI